MKKLEGALFDFFEGREGEGAFQRLRAADLLQIGLIDSLDMVELAALISSVCEVRVDLSDSRHFDALRSIDGMLAAFEP